MKENPIFGQYRYIQLFYGVLNKCCDSVTFLIQISSKYNLKVIYTNKFKR